MRLGPDCGRGSEPVLVWLSASLRLEEDRRRGPGVTGGRTFEWGGPGGPAAYRAQAAQRRAKQLRGGPFPPAVGAV